MPVQQLPARRIAELRAAPLTYSEVGMTRASDGGAGYRRLCRSVALPARADFDQARLDLRSWAVQRRAGIGVAASGDVEPDAVVELRLGFGPIGLSAPCRVVYVIDETDRFGFAYGTLPGHPESGEEAFVLDRTAGTFTITALSRPASRLARIAGPLARGAQHLMTMRYLGALA